MEFNAPGKKKSPFLHRTDTTFVCKHTMSQFDAQDYAIFVFDRKLMYNVSSQHKAHLKWTFRLKSILSENHFPKNIMNITKTCPCNIQRIFEL